MKICGECGKPTSSLEILAGEPICPRDLDDYLAENGLKPWNWTGLINPTPDDQAYLDTQRSAIMNDHDRTRLIALLNDLEETRQDYDNAVVPEHPKLDRVLKAGDQLSNVAYELHNFLVTRVVTPRTSRTGQC